MNCHPWTEQDDDDSLVRLMKLPKEIDAKSYMLTKGVPVSSWFPSDVVFDFAPNGGMKPGDSVRNVLGLHIVSEKLRDILVSSAGARFEFLPVKLRNHKKKLVPEPYYVANLLDVVSCVDRARSVFTVNELFKDRLRDFERLVLDPGRLGPDTKLFRLGENTELVVVREDLARAILHAGCTGMKFMPMEDYGAELRLKDNYDL
ncbi:imm11 family protein [Myxococcus qinghaiensis]|uniref:imm11 family protein n=1 Tax=Myxococcus qinghaiensis TaxID=2906758 RepID=UPI0038996CF3